MLVSSEKYHLQVGNSPGDSQQLALELGILFDCSGGEMFWDYHLKKKTLFIIALGECVPPSIREGAINIELAICILVVKHILVQLQMDAWESEREIYQRWDMRIC